MEVSYEKIWLNEKTLFLFREFIQHRFDSPFHWHDEYELIYLKKGQGKLVAGNRVLNFKEGEVYFFAPRVSHAFFNIPEKKFSRAHAVVVHFTGNFLGDHFWKKTETVSLAGLLKKAGHGLVFRQLSDTLLRRFHCIGKKKGIERLTELLLVLEQLAKAGGERILLKENLPGSSYKEDHQVLEKVYRYVAENFQHAVHFSEAARIAHMHKAAFCRFFKRKTKKNFSAFVNEIRIAHAQNLLSETDKKVIDVCYECGYESLSYFNRQFKLLTGYTPREFRKRMRSA